MKNSNFVIDIDEKTGFIKSIVNPKDEHKMNWCSERGNWGKIKNDYPEYLKPFHNATKKGEPFELKKIEIGENKMIAEYENPNLALKVSRFFSEKGNFTERYVFKNISPSVFCLSRDCVGIEVPLNDEYTYADDCMINRCNTHIWCGRNSSWINALKMGESKINLGIMLTKGSFVSYSQDDCFGGTNGNIRGNFILEPETVFLKQGGEYTVEWEMFWHEGKEDFLKKTEEYPSYIGIKAEHLTVFRNESINFEITPSNGISPEIYLFDERISAEERDGKFYVSLKPQKTGEHKFVIKCGEVKTVAEFMVKIPFGELVEKRIDFIVDKQQCTDKESPLYGAYLLYDNKIESGYFDFFFTDHNACRERMNMPLTIIRYLQLKNNEKVRKSLDLYMEFLFREFYEEKTGEVFNNIGKTADALRLYNAPGVMLIFAEMYHLTGDEKYLDGIFMLAEKYYSIGGERCYSNAVGIRKVISAFEKAGRDEDKKKMLRFFKMHTDVMIENGTSYPKHEVNYEQTIVTPAVTCISEMGLYSENSKYYAENVKCHIECLNRFLGQQPSFHLSEISIRYWDDYWFGYGRRRGDTFPQHLSCLSGRAYAAYARLTGDAEYKKRAEESIRNCMCLIDDDGKGHAAYVYPHKVNNEDGEFYDDFANDQDLPLYDAMNCNDLIEAFRLN